LVNWGNRVRNNLKMPNPLWSDPVSIFINSFLIAVNSYKFTNSL
jgi:hypothetical protein